jgi:hypothetical protein
MRIPAQGIEMTLYEKWQRWASPPSAQPRVVDVELWRAAKRLFDKSAPSMQEFDRDWRMLELQAALKRWQELTPNPPNTV